MSGSGAKVVAGAILLAAAAVCVAIGGQAAGEGTTGVAAGAFVGAGGLILLILGFKEKGREGR